MQRWWLGFVNITMSTRFWLLTGKRSAETNYIYIPRYDLTASAGPGSFVDLEPESEVIAVDRDWLRNELHVDPSTVNYD